MKNILNRLLNFCLHIKFLVLSKIYGTNNPWILSKPVKQKKTSVLESVLKFLWDTKIKNKNITEWGIFDSTVGVSDKKPRYFKKLTEDYRTYVAICNPLDTEWQNAFFKNSVKLNMAPEFNTAECTVTQIIAVKNIIRKLKILDGIIGVAGMSGPVSQSFLLRYKLDQNTGLGSLSINPEVASANIHKLSSCYSEAKIKDLSDIHGVNLLEEILLTIETEAVDEILMKVISDISKVCQKNETHEYDFIDIFETSDNLVLKINRLQNDIGRETKRGTGNYLITSAAGLSLLQSSFLSKFSKELPDDEVNIPGVLGLQYVGILNGTTKVYVSHTIGNKILVGYVGPNPTDTGAQFLPYAIMVSNSIDAKMPSMNTTTFALRSCLMADDKASGYYRIIDLVEKSASTANTNIPSTVL